MINAVLRTKTAPIAAFDDSARDLVARLFRAMVERGGIGLAAPQVGDLRRVAVVAVPGRSQLLINPVVIEATGRQRVIEGCLSLPGIAGTVRRAARVVVETMSSTGTRYTFTAEGLFAQAVQHEIDHLDGVLFVDHLGWWRRRQLLRHYEARRTT